MLSNTFQKQSLPALPLVGLGYSNILLWSPRGNTESEDLLQHENRRNFTTCIVNTSSRETKGSANDSLSNVFVATGLGNKSFKHCVWTVCLLLPTTCVVQRKIMFSLVFVCSWGRGTSCLGPVWQYVLSRYCPGGRGTSCLGPVQGISPVQVLSCPPSSSPFHFPLD